MRKEDIMFISQLVETLEQAELKLEEFHKNKDYTNFKRAKILITQVYKKINEVLQ
ncbi:MAG: hypothetical protein ABIB79_04530 [archaeon]